MTLPWLYTVARNRAVDELRRRQPLQTDASVLEEIPAPEPSAHKSGAGVEQVLASLSSEDREILHLFVFEGFTTAEIADILRIKPGAARVRLMRARERFRVAWEKI